MVKVVMLFFQVVQHFLLMQPIEQAIQVGSFQEFLPMLTTRISMHLDAPLNLYGYLDAQKFVSEFEHSFSPFKAERLEWISKQIDGDYAVQTINTILWNQGARKRVYYKWVFFLRRQENQWRLYHLRGLTM